MRSSQSKALLLLLFSIASGAAAVAADTPSKAPLKEGWNRKQIKVFAYACTDGLFEPAARDYYAAAKADGVDNPKPFPEKEFRDSAFPMCLCISQRVAETWPLADLQNRALQRSRYLIDEALNGGRCKPDGLLGDVLKNRKQNQPR